MAAEQKKLSSEWADVDPNEEDPVTDAAKDLEKSSIAATAAEESSAVPPTGLDPHDAKAEVDVKTSEIYQSAKSFEDLGLPEALLKGVYDMGFNRPSKIQGHALPVLLSSSRPSLIGQAHHGSGKTATFSLAMLTNVDSKQKHPQAICVTPTRELAVQIQTVINALGKFTDVHAALAVKGSEKVVITDQIVVGTPGTILNKIKHKQINPKKLYMFVVDEADKMLQKSGLSEQTLKIRKACPKQMQTLLFSATFPQKVLQFSRKVAKGATEITIKKEQLSLDAIQQFKILCDQKQKYELLTDMYGLLEIGQSIIFSQTIATGKELTNAMRADGYGVALLHGQMEPQDRDTVMEDFRTGKATVLITTNVLARGIDVSQVTLVINYDVPIDHRGQPDPETYIHRIGRSGRFGRKGVAVNFVDTPKTKAAMEYIEQHYGHQCTELPAGDIEKLSEVVKAALEAN
jgi:ATP-dependent RNA helicase DDX19/DBP5